MLIQFAYIGEGVDVRKSACSNSVILDLHTKAREEFMQ